MEDFNVTNNEDMGLELDPAEQLRELKANYVPKGELEKAIAERNKYFKMATTNYSAEQPEKEVKKSTEELRKEFFSDMENKTNLKLAEQALALRESIIENGGVDPFIPQGRKISATQADILAAENVAEGLQYCIDYAQGDPNLFRAAFNKITR